MPGPRVGVGPRLIGALWPALNPAKTLLRVGFGLIF